MKPVSEHPLFSFAIVADSHLSKKEHLLFDDGDSYGSRLATTYDDLIKRINAMNPAFVVHLGDITDPVPVSPDFDDSAQAFHSASKLFDMPYHLVPGNHDVGEKIHPALPSINDRVSITSHAIEQYEQHFGRQRYSFEYGDCLFVVINTMLLNSGLEEEQSQWSWLEETLDGSAGQRIFVFAHYPLYLSARDEPDYYDNIDEPARSRLIDLLGRHPVEGYYAGHVHNYFYNQLDGMHQFALPSTGIIRSDYMEFFRTTPTRQMGRLDPAKLGFFWVDVYGDGHVPHLVRASDDYPVRLHSWRNSDPSVTLDLRLPWCEEADIPSAWGLEIFERKPVRNDYPLAALWEMGIRELRIPVSDLLDTRVSRRVRELATLGHRFIVVMFGLPDKARRTALAEHADGIRAIEVVALFEQWQAFIEPLQALRQEVDFDVYLHAVRPEVEGWTLHHGLHTDLPDEVEWVLGLPGLGDAVDGFVFGIRRDVSPVDEYAAVQRCLDGTGYRALLHVPVVDMVWATNPDKEAAGNDELARVAQAVMLARANPGLSVVIDDFVEIDRGYCICQGLVDRLYNPGTGSRMVTTLHASLPRQLHNLTTCEAGNSRLLCAEHDDGRVWLLFPGTRSASDESGDPLPEGVPDSQGTRIDLENGTASTTTLGDVIAQAGREDLPATPVLFLSERR